LHGGVQLNTTNKKELEQEVDEELQQQAGVAVIALLQKKGFDLKTATHLASLQSEQWFVDWFAHLATHPKENVQGYLRSAAEGAWPVPSDRPRKGHTIPARRDADYGPPGRVDLHRKTIPARKETDYGEPGRVDL